MDEVECMTVGMIVFEMRDGAIIYESAAIIWAYVYAAYHW